ncbi:MAG: DNA gyrase subunit A [Cyanobacteriota bacterium]
MAKDTVFEEGRIVPINLREEMKRSYIDYAMSVIVGRALPDVRDGLKPVHRRILFAMNELGMFSDKPFKKCARIVGEVLGKYHPHGDTAVYDALVRLAQQFSSRYPLIDGHGNFGSIDGDSPAAMRYTEARLEKVSTSLLSDIDCDTVDFSPNFDGSLEEPDVLPVRLPVLLLNGSSGIAVGMATNIPPHNMGELIDGLIAYIDDPEITIDELYEYIKGPDFPTAATITGTVGIRQAYQTGRGSIVMRAVTSIEQVEGGTGKLDRTALIVSELPYQVNKANLIEKIAELVKDKRIEGISDLRDESDRDGIRIVIELKRDAKPDVVKNNLFKSTQLQNTFGVNMLALVNKQPRLLNLLDILEEFVEHRVEVITRRTSFYLNKAKARAHILKGLMIALGDLDNIIETIKNAKTTEDARNLLMGNYNLDNDQANAILEMQLRRLTGLEQEKINNEFDELQNRIAELTAILESREKILEIIKQELLEDKEKYADERRTEILPDMDEYSIKDLTPNDPMAVFITTNGYIKRIPLNTFERQNRATRGKGGMKTRDDDDVHHFFTTTMHSAVLFFSSRGVAYSLNVYEFPEGGRHSKGLPIINLLPLEQNEKITAVIPIAEFKEDMFLVMLTEKGYIKRVELQNFNSIRKNGLIAIKLADDDSLEWVKTARSTHDIIIGTSHGMAIRFSCDQLRPLGRTARGVTAIKLRKGDSIVGCDVIPRNHDGDLLIITTDGYGKRTKLSQFRPQNRGGIGLIALKFKSMSSRVITILVVKGESEIMISSRNGVVTRQVCESISRQSRTATGVNIQSLDDDDYVAAVTRLATQKKKDPANNEEIVETNQIPIDVVAEVVSDKKETEEE